MVETVILGEIALAGNFFAAQGLGPRSVMRLRRTVTSACFGRCFVAG
jgi:hypothetical protein